MNGIGQRLSTQWFTVDDKGLPGGLLEMCHPVEQCRLVGVRGQAANRVNLRAYLDTLAKQSDLTRAIDQPSTQRPRSLEANNQDGAFTASEIVA